MKTKYEKYRNATRARNSARNTEQNNYTVDDKGNYTFDEGEIPMEKRFIPRTETSPAAILLTWQDIRNAADLSEEFRMKVEGLGINLQEGMTISIPDSAYKRASETGNFNYIRAAIFKGIELNLSLFIATEGSDGGEDAANPSKGVNIIKPGSDESLYKK